MFRIHYGVTVTATRHYNVLYVGETFRKVREGCMYYRNIFIEFPSLEVIMSSWCHPKSTDDQLLTVSTISRLVKSISLSSPCWVSAGVEIPAGWDDSDDGGVGEGAGGHDHGPAAHSEAPVSLAASQHSTEPRVMRASRVRRRGAQHSVPPHCSVLARVRGGGQSTARNYPGAGEMALCGLASLATLEHPETSLSNTDYWEEGLKWSTALNTGTKWWLQWLSHYRRSVLDTDYYGTTASLDTFVLHQQWNFVQYQNVYIPCILHVCSKFSAKRE